MKRILLMVLGACLGISGLIGMLVYRFSHPDLTETQLMFQSWEWIVMLVAGAIIFVVINLMEKK